MWFKVDDSFHSHPKALEASLAAIGLWALAGSWTGDHRKDGFVSDQAVKSLSRGALELADELVTAGLWKRTKGGYRFHQWDQRNPVASHTDRIAIAKATGGVLGNHLRWHTKNGKQNPECQFCQDKEVSDNRSDTDRISDPISDRNPNPDPTRTKEIYAEAFNEFWTIYPRKKVKDASRQAYTRARKRGASHEEILAGAVAYRSQCQRERTDEKFIAHATTWLNQGRWKDHLGESAEAAHATRSLWEN